MRVWVRAIAAGAAVAVLAAGTASAAITLDFGQDAFSSEANPTGASGLVVLSFADEAGDVRMSATVTNTTGNLTFGLGATSSKLTAFGLNLVDGASYVDGTFLAGAYLDKLIQGANAAPFGELDIAGADNGKYNSGDANGALPENTTDTFSLRLATALDAAGLEDAFLTAFTTIPQLTAALRFQQVEGGLNNGGSDKLKNPTVEMSPVPVPPAALSLLLGFGGLGAIGALRQRLRRRAVPA